MKHIFKGLPILIFLNLTLFGVIYYLQKGHKNDAEPLSNKALALNIDWESLSDIQIQHTTTNTQYLLIKKEQNWYIQKPIEWPANPYAVLAIIHKLSLANQQAIAVIPDISKSEDNLSQYGLDNPAYIITLNASNQKQVFTIGQPTSFGNRVYALSSDQKSVIAIPSECLDSFIIPLEELQNSSIFELSTLEIEGLTLKLDTNNLTILLAKKNKEWAFEAPIQTSANTSLVEKTISQLLSLKTKRFLIGQEAEQANVHLNTPSMRITLMGTKRRQTLRIGQFLTSSNEYEAKIEGSHTLFTLSPEVVDTLKLAQENLRDPEFFKINPKDISSIALNQKDQTLSLQKLENNQWSYIYTTPNTQALRTQEADSLLVHTILNSLKHLHALDFVTDTPSETEKETFGLTSPYLSISLQTYDHHKYTLLIGSLNNNHTLAYAQIQDSPFIYQISANILEQLPLNPNYYHNRTLYTQPEKAIFSSIKLINLETGKEYLNLEFLKEQEEVDPLAEYSPHKKKNIEECLSLLKHLIVKEYTHNLFNSQTYTHNQINTPWQFCLQVTSFLPNNQEGTLDTQCYYFSQRLGGNQQIGGSELSKYTFLLTQEMMDTLFALTFEKMPPPLPVLANQE